MRTNEFGNSVLDNKYGVPVTVQNQDIIGTCRLTMRGFHTEWVFYEVTKEELYYRYRKNALDEVFRAMLNHRATTLRQAVSQQPDWNSLIPSVSHIVDVYPKEQTYKLLDKFDNLDIKL